MAGSPKQKHDILQEYLGGRYVGGSLSELASYSDLFRRMNEAVFLIDRTSFRIIECNPAALSLLDRSENEVLGAELSHVVGSGSTALALEGALKRLSDDAEARLQAELEFQDPEGNERFLEVSATRLKILDYIEVIQFMARDVTEVRQARNHLEEMNQALQALSTTDEMTGLKNYRYLKEILATVQDHAQKFNDHYGVIFIDVDHFKQFNDQNGHPAGDEVLRTVAQVLKSTCRSQDLPCRYGGEEFVVLCRSASLKETEERAEVIRKAIESQVFPHEENQPLGKVTVSLGVAAYPESAKDYEALLKQADEALYHSKQQGRNQVTSTRILKKNAA